MNKKKHNGSNPNIWIPKEVIKSPAFRTLSAAAMSLYLHFLMKRQMGQAGRSGKQKWIIKNNGEIIFTYAMGKSDLDMPSTTLMRCIDKLADHGLIDVTYSGSGGRKGDCSKYAISNRWKKFGTDGFIKNPRPKDLRRIGFRYYPQHIKREVAK